MKTLANKWGPVPRILLRILETPSLQVDFEQDVANAIDEVIENPSFVFTALAGHNSAASYSDSSTVFFIKPETHRSLHTVYIPTGWLMSRLVDRLVREKDDARAKFFDVINARRVISGSMLEGIAHEFLTRGEIFTIRWFDQDIGTGGPVLTVPLRSFGFKLLVSCEFDFRDVLMYVFCMQDSDFETNGGTSTGGSSVVAEEAHSDGSENVRTSKRRRTQTGA